MRFVANVFIARSIRFYVRRRASESERSRAIPLRTFLHIVTFLTVCRRGVYVPRSMAGRAILLAFVHLFFSCSFFQIQSGFDWIFSFRFGWGLSNMLPRKNCFNFFPHTFLLSVLLKLCAFNVVACRHAFLLFYVCVFSRSGSSAHFLTTRFSLNASISRCLLSLTRFYTYTIRMYGVHNNIYISKWELSLDTNQITYNNKKFWQGVHTHSSRERERQKNMPVKIRRCTNRCAYIYVEKKIDNTK